METLRSSLHPNVSSSQRLTSALDGSLQLGNELLVEASLSLVLGLELGPGARVRTLLI